MAVQTEALTGTPMAVQTEALTGARRLVTPGQLWALFVPIAVLATLVFLWEVRETPTPRVAGLSASAIENSRAFVREQGVPQAQASEPVFGSGAYFREYVAVVALIPEAIHNSRAHVREMGSAPATYSYETFTQARESVSAPRSTLSPDVLFSSAAHIREAAS